MAVEFAHGTAEHGTPAHGGAGDNRPRPFFGSYKRTLPRTWWLRNRNYSFFALRELTVIPMVLWLAFFLYEIWISGWGEAAYLPGNSPLYIAFSVVCFGAALLHSITWLNLSGVILRIKLGANVIAPRLVTLGNYAQWVGVTIVVGALLVWLSTWRS
jgi:fumarate reductase subunit C